MDNRISDMPDDILNHIISSLSMKEAGKTSVLSKRWKHVWTYTTTLNFDSRSIIIDLMNDNKLLEEEEPKYLNWVEQVITLHKAPVIDEFKVQFNISVDNIEDNVDNWLRFVMDKKVKKFEMDFSLFYGNSRRGSRFSFPKWFSCISITSLELGLVDVNGEILDGLLCTCLALEVLSVKYSLTLFELNVVGPNLKLKSLVIYICRNMKKLVISAPNLVFLCYDGPKLDMQLESTPKLAQLSIGGRYVDNMIDCFSDFPSQSSQIEELTLSPFIEIEKIKISIEDFLFPRLRKLDVSVDVYGDDNICFIASLLRVCPLLQHFVLQLSVRSQRMGIKMHTELIPCPHYHLKTVEIIGIIKPIHMDIASFLIENAFVLEKITVDPRPIYLTGGMPMDEEEIMEATTGAEKIRAHVKHHTKLEILPVW